MAQCDQKPPPPPARGSARAKYYVLTVIYAPPGTQGGGSKSSVSYGSGSTTGSTVSSTNSFKQAYGVTVSASGGVLAKVEIGGSFNYARTASNTETLDIKKSTTSEISVSGPSVDGIDHERDQIWLWLSPLLDVTVTDNTAEWAPHPNQQADLQFVYVGWLKDPSKMPPGVVEALQASGITSQDYQDILRIDPYGSASPALDRARYQPLNTTFPYEPPFAPGDPVPTYKVTINYSSNAVVSSSVQAEYTVGLTVSGGVDFFGLFKASVKEENKWTWTSLDTRTSSTSTSETAAVTVGGPAFGYTGSTDVAVYYDVVYKTFLFTFVDRSLSSLHGFVRTRSGEPVRQKEVLVVAGGVRYRTFTDAYGEYHIYGRVSGPVQVKVGRAAKRLATPPASRAVDVIVP